MIARKFCFYCGREVNVNPEAMDAGKHGYNVTCEEHGNYKVIID